MADQEIEYESDPEEAKLSLKLRRREASDDEEEEEDGGGNRGEKPPRRIDDSDGESEGAAAEYEDGEEDYDLDGEEYLEDEIEVTGVVYDVGGGGGGLVETAGVPASEVMLEGKELSNDTHQIDNEDSNIADGEHEGEKKENEPFAVPTAGAFYMHDDRFRDNARGRNRRTLGGKKLWESKDDKKWGHDKFEELSMHERHHDEPRRGSRGRYRGRGRNRGMGRGFAQGSRPREYTNTNITQSNNNQKNAPKGVRGRGPRRYQPSFKNNNEAPVAQKNLYVKSVEKNSNVNSGKTTQAVSNSESDVVQPKKQVASILNIASPPFYPTGSSSKESTMPLKRDVQASTSNRNSQQSAADENSNIARSMRGKNTVDSIGMDKLYIDDSASAMAGKPRSTMQVSVTGPVHLNTGQPQFRGQGRGLNSMEHVAYQPDLSSNQSNKVPQPSPPQSFQRNSGQNRGQSSGQAPVQRFTQRLPGGLQSSPPKNAGSVNSFESGDQEPASESSQVKNALVTKGKGVVQGSGKGSFLYGSPQALGATGSMSSGHSDQNFPTFLPVMQFGGQHPGGIGVPAVGMAFPGYVGQPQLGLGSSEMTWLPVLAGAAGALGATYCPPYIAVDGSYNARPTGQAPSTTATSSKDASTMKGSNDWKSQNPEIASEDFGQRQKNPRRYTEMKFDQ